MANAPEGRAGEGICGPSATLNRCYWQARYDQGQTGWDRGGASPTLLRWLAAGDLRPCRILVPGCGRGHEVVALAKAGFDVTGVDFAPAAVETVRATSRAKIWLRTSCSQISSHTGLTIRSGRSTSRPASVRCRRSSGRSTNSGWPCGSPREAVCLRPSCRRTQPTDRPSPAAQKRCGSCLPLIAGSGRIGSRPKSTPPAYAN
jgi:hypothetical protein